MANQRPDFSADGNVCKFSTSIGATYQTCILPVDFSQVEVLFFNTRLFTDTEQKQRSYTSHPSLWRSRVGSDGCNSDGKGAEFNFPSWNVWQGIDTLQQENMLFTLLDMVKTNTLPQGQGWSGNEFSIRMPGGLSRALGMGRDVEPVLMGTERPSAFLLDGKERGGQTLHPPCLSPAPKSPSVILRG